jgi:hypothetical protein
LFSIVPAGQVEEQLVAPAGAPGHGKQSEFAKNGLNMFGAHILQDVAPVTFE